MHIEPTHDAGRRFFGAPPEGPIVMLNLLRFREVADYSASPELAPEQPVSGAEAYGLYAQFTMPLLAERGSKVLFQGRGGGYLIGPFDAQWDLVLLVEHRSAEEFLAFASDPTYLKTAGHRTAALIDSRLLPIAR